MEVLVIRLVVATVLGGLIGLERELHKKPAGLRTHMLVCLAACLFTVLSIDAFPMDPARVAASVVAGIGFIGAGTIIGEEDKIVGVTTAASLWVCASVGLAIGLGYLLLGFVSTLLTVFILFVGRIAKKVLK
ncbi:MAG TPA: MgtC/SapB family protein [Thermococcus sp.]|nr:MgtC/SapB family protein [Thermococcus sp.]